MQSKLSLGRFFEDFQLGEVIQHATPRTITAGDCALYIALTGARQPLFCSQPFAQSLGYPSQPVDDLLAFHIAFGKTVPDISVNAVANLGYADVRFCHPVYVGDTLSTRSEVIGLKQNTSGKNGVVWVRSTTVNQDQTTVLTWVRWVMVHKHRLEAPAPATTVPQLPAFVAPEQLPIAASLKMHGEIAAITGSGFFWEDYAVGERINHRAGLTINDSDHTLATHLYQNNARLHFDAHLMQSSAQGQRLVYGGVVISACRAISYEGLENALCMLAINAGSHNAPSFAGDTLYCATEVIDRWSLPASHPHAEQVGALRLRMLGIKNMLPEAITSFKTEQGYHPSVVLDLDYTVLIPKKGLTS